MLDVPRSVLLSLWGSAVLDGTATLDAAVAAVTGDDGAHLLIGEDLPFSANPAGPGLADLLDQLAGRAVGLRAVLPVPGDALGVPGGPDLSGMAIEAGEAVVTIAGELGDPVWVLVPQVQQFGSDLEPGWRVTWQQHRVSGLAPATAAAWIGVAEADQRLRLALAAATDELDGLDVARWRRDSGTQLSRLRAQAVNGTRLPPATAARAVKVLDQAVRVRGIVHVAREDDGAAITGWESGRRSQVLRELDAAARQALVAVTIPRGLA